MPNLFVRSTDGSDSDNGTTWALAKATICTPTTGTGAIEAAGDTVYVDSAHVETFATNIGCGSTGTAANPSRWLSVSSSGDPSAPTVLAAGAKVTTSVGQIILTGSAYRYGFSYTANGRLTVAESGGLNIFEDCSFEITGSGTYMTIGVQSAGLPASVGMNTRLINPTFKWAVGDTYLWPVGKVEFVGGGFAVGSVTPTTMVRLNVTLSGVDFSWDNADLSNLASTMVLFAAGGLPGAKAVIRGAKLPASWPTGAGGLCSGVVGLGQRYEMWDCSAGAFDYKLWVEDYFGSIKDEATVVRTGGASDGTTTYSWKMATNANGAYPLGLLRSPEVFILNDTTGSPITIECEVVTDNVTLTDQQIWLEVSHKGTAGFPIRTRVSDAKATVLATAANQTTSTETWTTTGLTTPVKQKLAVTFTPQRKGALIATVVLARASTTVFVDLPRTV